MVWNERHLLVQEICQTNQKPGFKYHLRPSKSTQSQQMSLSPFHPDSTHVVSHLHPHQPQLALVSGFSRAGDFAISLAQISALILDISFLTKAFPT